MNDETPQRRRTDEGLMAERNRFRDFADCAADWYWEQDADLRYVEITGVDLEHRRQPAPTRFIGLTRREMNPPGVSEEQWAQHEADLAARRPFRNFRYERIDVDGKRHYLSVSGTPIIDENGEFKGYRGIGRNETELRQALAMLQAQAAELRIARVEAEAANHAKSNFLANMSHEFRTPLNAIMGFAEIIRDRRFGDCGLERYSDYAADIYQCGQSLLEMISDLLDLSKIEARRYTVGIEEVGLREFLDDCIHVSSILAVQGGVSLHCEVEPGLRLSTDRRGLRHIITNLISNSVKFTEAGGSVWVKARSHGRSQISIVVEDTGVGMSAEFLKRAFEPFEQADSALSRRHGGTGLGLSVASAYAKLLGARLKVRSREGVGTRFAVIFGIRAANDAD